MPTRQISTVVTGQPSPTQSVHMGAPIPIPTHPGLAQPSAVPIMPVLSIPPPQNLHPPPPGTTAGVFPTHMPPPNFGLPPPSHSGVTFPTNIHPQSTGQYATAAAFDPTRPPPMIQPLTPVNVEQMAHVNDLLVGKVMSPATTASTSNSVEPKEKREKLMKERSRGKSSRTESESSGGDRKEKITSRSSPIKRDQHLEEGGRRQNRNNFEV